LRFDHLTFSGNFEGRGWASDVVCHESRSTLKPFATSTVVGLALILK
jgi:hypothetical protein